MTLEDEFTAVLRGTVEAAQRLGYPARRFSRMLDQYRGVATAKRLIAKEESQSGLDALWELRLLNNSMEAEMLRSRFRSLFTAEELAEARKRLEDRGMDTSSID